MSKARRPRPIDTQLSQVNRAVLPSCQGCLHWQPAELVYGRCRRFPPLIPTGILSVSGPVCTFALTRAEDLCGEFEPRAQT